MRFLRFGGWDVVGGGDREKGLTTYLLAVRGAEIETVGSLFITQLLLLKFHDLHQGLVHRLQHLG